MSHLSDIQIKTIASMTRTLQMAIKTGYAAMHLDLLPQQAADLIYAGDVNRYYRAVSLALAYDRDHFIYPDDAAQLHAMLQPGGAGADYLGISIQNVLDAR